MENFEQFINLVLNGNLTTARKFYRYDLTVKDRGNLFVYAVENLSPENLARLVFGLGIPPQLIPVNDDIKKQITEAYFKQYPELQY